MGNRHFRFIDMFFTDLKFNLFSFFEPKCWFNPPYKNRFRPCPRGLPSTALAFRWRRLLCVGLRGARDRRLGDVWADFWEHF